MIGPHVRLIERDTGVCGFYAVPQGMWKPLALPGGRYWIPPSSGISGSPGTYHSIMVFALREIFWDLPLRNLLGLSRGANAGKMHSQTSHSY